MINRLLFSAICLGLVSGVSADNLKGFEYARATAPTGKEWESPERLSLNKEQPHAWFFSFVDVDAARKVLPENSRYWMSLNGTWKFHWVGNPEERPEKFYECDYDVSGWDDIAVPGSWNIQGLQKDGTQKYGTPVYVNQPVIFYHERKVDDWRQGVMRTPPSNWTTYKNRNEVGSYRRTFSVPFAWSDREIYINFDGVDSFFYLWVNGQYVGFSKNSRNLAQFNITPYLKTGENSVSVEVYRSSDGSFLEAQDMFRLPGIFRTVALEAKPKVQVRDVLVTPLVQPDGGVGTLAIKALLRNALPKDVRNWQIDYTLYANVLYSDENTKADAACSVSVKRIAQNGGETEIEAELMLARPKLWSAEAPYRYVVVGQLKDSKGNVVETFSTYTGFRNVEIKDTKAEDDEFGLAGRYFYVNGKPVKLKGVNRHESEPSVGHALTRAMMENDLFLM
ncbi:MAG: glycoside hydrolase family 2 TIM barrel-domain containing protein, partial [Bacteroidales bacterium]|nr:glycoside hydrolase family 2 TIM barrel-domain containing protein [Bacteroidales bacterium]